MKKRTDLNSKQLNHMKKTGDRACMITHLCVASQVRTIHQINELKIDHKIGRSAFDALWKVLLNKHLSCNVLLFYPINIIWDLIWLYNYSGSQLEVVVDYYPKTLDSDYPTHHIWSKFDNSIWINVKKRFS